MRVQRDCGRHADSFECQSALERDPVSAPKRASFERGVLALSLKSGLSNLLDEAPGPADSKSAGTRSRLGEPGRGYQVGSRAPHLLWPTRPPLCHQTVLNCSPRA